MGIVSEGAVLWEPSPAFMESSTLAHYMRWLGERGRSFPTYHALWEWSVTDLPAFWASIWDYCGVEAAEPYTEVLADEHMPGARWFTGARVNYAEHAFRGLRDGRPAVIFQSEIRPLTELSGQELRDQVAACGAALKALGVGMGDRVAAYLPNIPETLVAFLACASLGAIWSSCSPDFGSRSVIDRFAQIEPKVLLAVDGYSYNGTVHDRLARTAELLEHLPTVEHTIVVGYADRHPAIKGLRGALHWHDLLARHTGASLNFTPVPFDHPLWVLYSSGTTGLPKAIVQGHGGILLEHLKTLRLGKALKPGDRFFWFATTGWMMWNLLISGLHVGTTVLLYDGSVSYPDLGVLWRFAEASGMTCFGTSAAYLTACMNAGIRPKEIADLSRLISLGSTGSPLSPEGFAWVYEAVKADIWLASVSGGTDVCTAFVGGCPLHPVRAGEIQCRSLGAAVAAYDEQGRPVIDQVGELVVTRPMPSMPLYFWNDPGNARYIESYFSMYPGTWRHGDWIKITARGSCVIYGRSDSTINRLGVRMGTSDIYRVVEDLPEVADCLVVDLEGLGGASYMPLFVVLAEGAILDDALQARIKARIRSDISPRHVPDAIFAIPAVPRTLNGKKLEVPIRKILLGTPVEKAVSQGSLGNPDALDFFVALSGKLGR
jgi:acetoacetyl-CoA synthetase